MPDVPSQDGRTILRHLPFAPNLKVIGNGWLHHTEPRTSVIIIISRWLEEFPRSTRCPVERALRD